MENYNKSLALIESAGLKQKAVSAKMLYRELSNGNISHYNRWVKKNIIDNNLYDENIDYCITHHSGDYSGRGQLATDYALTLDFAKELCMMSKCAKGKDIRRYFIECEKQLKESQLQQVPQTYLEALKALVASEEAKQQAEQELAIAKPKAEFNDRVLNADGLYTITQIAKDFGLSARAANKLLADWGIQYKQSGIWQVYAEYQDKGYTMTRTSVISMQDGNESTRVTTCWTNKGREFLVYVFEEHGYKLNSIRGKVEEN